MRGDVHICTALAGKAPRGIPCPRTVFISYCFGFFGCLELCKLLLFKDAVCYLADEGLRHIVLEFNIVGHCVLGDVLAAVIHKSAAGIVVRGNVRTELYERLDLLYLVGVGIAYDAAHLNIIVRIENIFKLPGVDIVAGGDYHALCAALEVDKALVDLRELQEHEDDADGQREDTQAQERSGDSRWRGSLVADDDVSDEQRSQ